MCEECVGKMRRSAELSTLMRKRLDEKEESGDVVAVRTECPVCGREFKKGDEKPNEELRALVEGECVYYCDFCEEKREKATKFCLHCKTERKNFVCFCDTCWDVVHKIGPFRSHVLHEHPPVCVGFDGYLNPRVDDGEAGGREKKYPICLKHGRAVVVKKKEDGVLLCDVCLNEMDVKAEETERVEDVVEGARKRL